MANDPANNRCAVLTPAGRGAIAVIGICGTTALSELECLFQSVSGRSITSRSAQHIFYGHWIATGEDVVVVRATEERTEIHCHGGRAAAAAILQSLVDVGFRIVEQTEVASLLHLGCWKSEIATAITQALTERTATLLLQQYSLVDAYLHSLKLRLERLMDSTEKATTSARTSFIDELESMLRWYDFGRHLTKPWSVVLCGRPNVGKSSLANAIVGFNRAIVHESAGTTRDVVSQMTAIDGWPIELKDTAGLRSAETEIERIGIHLTETEICRADLAVLVLDATSISAVEGFRDESLLKSAASMVVVNKIDLLESTKQAEIKSRFEQFPMPHVITSSVTGAGISELIQAIGDRLVNELPSRGILIPINSHQHSELRELQQCVQAGDFEAALEKVRQWIRMA